VPKASLFTLGCRLNQAETAIIAKKLSKEGYQIVEFGETADLTVINTCTVTAEADAKCRKAVRKSIRKNPQTFVAVIGCYAQMGSDTIKDIDGVDLIVGNEHKFQITDFLDDLNKKDAPAVVHSKISRDTFTIEDQGLFDQNTRANIKIQDGCNFVCSFCIIAKARGPARSREFDDILKEAVKLVDAGHQELVLTGVNIGTYRYEDRTFMDVLKEMEKIDGLKRIRISSVEPSTIDKNLIDYMADSEKICRYLHIPLQSGDDKILESMRRKHTAAEFAELIEYAAHRIPDIGLGTDVMVGYPLEDDEAFKNTKRLLADLPVTYFHVFTYSDREGTTSYQIKPKVDHHVKKGRMRIMIQMGQRKQNAFYDRFLGKSVDVLFETQKEDNWSGLTDNYMRIQVNSKRDLYNKFLPVRLEEVAEERINGKLI